jgi:hypothetical protein
MRRKLMSVAAAAFAAVTLFAVMPATAAQATTRTVESVIGAGTINSFGSPTVYLGAIGNQRGQLGAFTVTYPDGTYATGASNCLVVNNKTAYLTGKIALSGGPRRAANSWQRGNYMVIGIKDNGNGTDVMDELNFTPGTTADPGCGPNAVANPNLFLVKGNYWVTDAG